MVRYKFNLMLAVATIAMAVNFVVMISGALVAGNILGAEALAGINVCTPIFAAVGFLGSLISVGSGLVFSRSMGAFDSYRAAVVWSQSFLSAVVIGALIWLLMTFGGSAFIDFSGVTGSIRAEAVAYWRWQSVSMAFMPLVLLVMAMVYADGDGMVVMVAGIVYVLGSLGLSWLATLGLKNAGGVSLGATLSMILVLLTCALHFLRRNNHLRFVRGLERGAFAETIVNSLPDSMIYLCWALLVLVINRFTVAYFGEEHLAIVAFGVSIIEFSIVFDGIGEALIPVGGMYAGERNAPALHRLANHAAQVAVIEGVIVGAVFYFFAMPIADYYGFRAESMSMLSEAVMAIKALAWAMPFMAVLMMMNTYYLIVGKPWFAIAITVMKDFALPCVMALVGGMLYGFRGIWGGFSLGYMLAVVITLLFVLFKYGRQLFPWLVEVDEKSDDFTIRLGEESLKAAKARLAAKLEGCGIEVLERVIACVEVNAVAMKARNYRKSPLVEYFLSFESAKRVRLIIRDNGVLAEPPKIDGVSECKYIGTLSCNCMEYHFQITK